MDSSVISGLIGGMASVAICSYISAKNALTFRSGNKVRISTMLSGHGGMLAMLEQKGLPLHL